MPLFWGNGFEGTLYPGILNTSNGQHDQTTHEKPGRSEDYGTEPPGGDLLDHKGGTPDKCGEGKEQVGLNSGHLVFGRKKLVRYLKKFIPGLIKVA